MKIYFDACCVNRLTDDQSHQRIRAEAESIEAILENVRQGTIAWVISPVLTEEIQRSPQIERRRENGAHLALATSAIEVSDRFSFELGSLRLRDTVDMTHSIWPAPRPAA